MTELVKWDELSVMISEASDIETLKSFSDKLEALRILAKQSKESLKTQNRIAEYRLAVERKKGTWLDENMPRGALPGTNNRDGERTRRMTLDDIGVTRNESSRARKLAAMDEDDFEDFIKLCWEGDHEITLKGAVSAAFRSARRGEQDERKLESELTVVDSAMILGDCLEVIPTLQDEGISCFLIDPPYGIKWAGGRWSAEGVPNKFVKKNRYHEELVNDDLEGAIHILDASLEAVKPKLKDGAHIYVFTTWHLLAVRGGGGIPLRYQERLDMGQGQAWRGGLLRELRRAIRDGDLRKQGQDHVVFGEPSHQCPVSSEGDQQAPPDREACLPSEGIDNQRDRPG